MLSYRDADSPFPFYEMEYAVRAECAAQVMRATRRLMRDQHPEREHPLLFRFAAGDDAHLSPFLRA
ncbi:D-arabinono-1,4-lactone oxidase [Streptomyces sp. NPDC057900]|uniref:D-arabinono-1,4-lactone oxidase n=1 Tax=Streptomyces sp. NPDC057900 TaxID=3346274 RepID=UPI0036EABE87